MNKVSALLLLFLASCSAAVSRRYLPAVPGLTLQEVEERHRIVYRDLPNGRATCNGFAVDSLTVYTAEHCAQGASPFLGDGTSLETILSLPERDLVILSPEVPLAGLRKAPLYEGKLHLGDVITLVVYASDKRKMELVEEFPQQAEPTPSGLLQISGPIINFWENLMMLNKSCEPYHLRNVYTIAAPGRRGFSGGPVFVAIGERYYLAGFAVAIERPGETQCTKTLMERNAVTFSPIYDLSLPHLVQR